ncbi:MAG: alpha-glucosidase/alpha-galactosidase [Clostridiales bacterium]|nr:alpha-glucosidase/alpha-galactosidase [Clostridiales bacterium]
MKIAFMGAGSTVFAKNVLGDVMCSEALRDSEISLYDIDKERLEQSELMVNTLNKNINDSRAKIKSYIGVENRKEALRGADFVVDAIQVGFYDPCTIIDFEVPKKYGLRQTIADTTGIGGIFRALRTIPVLADFAADMEEVCPDAWFLNYTNPMAMLSGFMQRYTGVNTVGLCHSVQMCARGLLNDLEIEYSEPIKECIAGITHMGWLVELYDADGTDLYPAVRAEAKKVLESGDTTHHDLVRYEYIRRFGYYCTESSEHNAEYNSFFIKSKYPELIKRYNIPLDEYPRRCINQIESWKKAKEKYLNGEIRHSRTREYASYIMEAMVTDVPYKIGGNVLNKGHIIPNLPEEACVEVACLVNKYGVQPCMQKPLPVQLAAMNMTEINVHLLTIEAAVTRKKEHIYQAAMLDPHCSSELSIDDIISMCDELIDTHGDWLPKYH